MKFIAGDRVAWEYIRAQDKVIKTRGKIISVEGRMLTVLADETKTHWALCRSWCRLIKKKERRRIWINRHEGLAWNNSNKTHDITFVQPSDDWGPHENETIEFVEVKKK